MLDDELRNFDFASVSVRYSSRSAGAMMATPLALATPTLIGAPLGGQLTESRCR